jgi:alpha-1,2-mannosyltransferase
VSDPSSAACDKKPQAAPRRTSVLFIALLVLLSAVVAARYTHKVLHGGGAIGRWRQQIQQMDQVDIADRFNYPNPPIMAVLLEPLVLLPPLVGDLTWFYLKLGMAVAALAMVFRLVEWGGAPFPPWAKMLAILCSLKPIIDDLNHGNVNLFILFLVVASLFAYGQRRDLTSGLLLALAISCKVTPALFVPWLIWKRAWMALAGCAVGLALFFYPGVVPGLRLGMEKNHQQLASWYHGMVEPFVFEGKVTSEHINQSLPGLVYRLATDSPSFVRFVDNVETPSRYDNALSLPPELARWFLKGCMALFAMLVIWCCRTPPEQRRGWQTAAEMSIVVLGMLLFSERTWKHHCVTFVLPFSVLCYHLGAVGGGGRLRVFVCSILFAALALTTLTGLGAAHDRDTAGDAPGFAKMALVYGAYTAACLALLAGLVVLLRSQRADPGGAGVGEDQPAALFPGEDEGVSVARKGGSVGAAAQLMS